MVPLVPTGINTGVWRVTPLSRIVHDLACPLVAWIVYVSLGFVGFIIIGCSKAYTLTMSRLII